VVKEGEAVLIVLVRRHRRAVGAAVRRAVDDDAPGAVVFRYLRLHSIFSLFSRSPQGPYLESSEHSISSDRYWPIKKQEGWHAGGGYVPVENMGVA